MSVDGNVLCDRRLTCFSLSLIIDGFVKEALLQCNSASFIV